MTPDRIKTVIRKKFGINKLKRIVVFTYSLFLIPYHSFSQQTQIYAEPQASYEKAMMLFDQQKYSAAAHLFESVSQSINEEQSTLKVNSDYYAAVCDLYL